MLCQLMDGDISVESDPGKGSTFRFSLLFAPIDTKNPSSGSRQTLPAGGASRSLRILLVEDNETNRGLGRMVLGNMGHEVLIATDGMRALHALADQDVDVVLMDVQMPGWTAVPPPG